MNRCDCSYGKCFVDGPEIELVITSRQVANLSLMMMCRKMNGVWSGLCIITCFLFNDMKWCRDSRNHKNFIQNIIY